MRTAVFVKLSIYIVLVLSLLTIIYSLPVGADPPPSSPVPCEPGSGSLPLPTWYQYLPGTTTADGTCEIATNGLGGKAVILVLMAIFDILLYLAGFIAVIMVIYSGFKFLISNGEPQKIAAARTTLLNALIGLGIAIVASQVVGFIAGRLV